jgi:hypothetical protein
LPSQPIADASTPDVKFGPPPAGHGYGTPELASAGADAAAAAPDAANVTVSTAAAARQDRTILGVFAIFTITELPPTPRCVVKPDQTFLDKLGHR